MELYYLHCLLYSTIAAADEVMKDYLIQMLTDVDSNWLKSARTINLIGETKKELN